MQTPDTNTATGLPAKPPMSDYTLRARTRMPHARAVASVREALQEQGFGVLTEIDVRRVMKDKLGLDVAAEIILGACRPELAHRALSSAPSLAALLPCNVVVRETGEGSTVVEAVDPAVMSQLEGHPEVASVAWEARRRLRAALDRVSQEVA
ncbi:DUF302 domain-containing protein [Nocardioides bigeumensis]|uniref:DUF302 domain-containing protein n=1 Tax=Nocardioides bigeumensis TaxID=433657 RepID=A0ABP5JSZ3_9ACTN